MRKKMSEDGRWILKRLADDDMPMFEQWDNVGSRKNLKEDIKGHMDQRIKIGKNQ